MGSFQTEQYTGLNKMWNEKIREKLKDMPEYKKFTHISIKLGVFFMALAFGAFQVAVWILEKENISVFIISVLVSALFAIISGITLVLGITGRPFFCTKTRIKKVKKRKTITYYADDFRAANNDDRSEGVVEYRMYDFPFWCKDIDIISRIDNVERLTEGQNVICVSFGPYGNFVAPVRKAG